MPIALIAIGVWLIAGIRETIDIAAGGWAPLEEAAARVFLATLGVGIVLLVAKALDR